MAGKRSYTDLCGIARGLDIVGERWALLVVRELLLGPKRFTDLKAGLPYVSPDVLTQRTRELEAAGVVRRVTLPPPNASRVYELTEWGRDLEPVVMALGAWGSRAPFPAGDARIGADSLALALLTVFEADAADGFTASYELWLGAHVFRVSIDNGRIGVSRGRDSSADATVVADPATMSALLWLGRSVADALRAGDLTVRGDLAAVERFVTLFPAPQVVTGVSG